MVWFVAFSPEERVLFRPSPAQFRGDLPVLPVRRPAATTSSRSRRRVPRRTALLPAGDGRRRGVQTIRRIHVGGSIKLRE